MEKIAKVRAKIKKMKKKKKKEKRNLKRQTILRNLCQNNKKREMTQIRIIRNEKRNIIIDIPTKFRKSPLSSQHRVMGIS